MSSTSHSTLIAAVHRLPSLSFKVLTTLVTERWFERPLSYWNFKELKPFGIESDRLGRLAAELATIDLTTAERDLTTHDISIISLGDSNYPPLLHEIPSPPPVLYVRGKIEALHQPSLAVVGTRQPTPYGLAVTESLLKPIVQARIVIISGLALGIDGQAHRIAVQYHVPTVAVLGCGVDRVYPWEHRQLAEDIIACGGAIISEFPLGAEPERHHFPRRNRIISGLARAVVLVEAGEKSGALITAKFAVDQNRDVLVVPGPITSPQSIGPLNWLKLGATPITSPTDLLRLFALEPAVTPTSAAYQPQTPNERVVIELLAHGDCHVDELVEKSRLDSSVVSATLSLLEIRGAVHHLGGLVYTLRT